MTKADFEAMHRDVIEIKEILIRREECAKKCEKVHTWAFGNGKAGADEIVARLSRWYGGVWQIATGVVTGVVVGVIVLIAGKYL